MCVCVCVCVCVFVCVCLTRNCIQVSSPLISAPPLRLYVGLCLCVSIWVCKCLCECVCMCVNMCVCMCVCASSGLPWQCPHRAKNLSSIQISISGFQLLCLKQRSVDCEY